MVCLLGGLALPVAHAADYDADNNGCPDPDRFADFTVTIEHTADTGSHPALVDDLEGYRVPTSPQTPNQVTGSCGDNALLYTWCADSRAYVPVLTHEDDPGPRGHLFLWFGGLGNRPADVDYVAQMGAFAGYRTINLSWDTHAPGGPNVPLPCPAPEDECDAGCFFAVSQELLTGVDDPSTDYPAHPMRGIEGKLALALEHLYEEDVNTSGLTNGLWDWNQYCEEDRIRWDRIETGGFSLGANAAAYISYLHPGSDHPPGNTIGVLAVDAGAPTCGDWADPAASSAAAYYPDEFDDHATWPPCGDTGGDTGDTGGPACPEENRFVMMHDTGSVALNLARVDLSLEQVSISSTPADVDTDITNGTLLDAGTGQLKASYGNLLRTAVNPLGHPHGSMAADQYMVSATDTGTTADVASDVYLLPLYLQALCELDQ